MAAKSLESPILNPEFPSVNFFNGRLLTGEDLSAEQAANREGRRRLGETIGGGIAYGLEVSVAVEGSLKDAPTVTVKSGVAINRLGQTIVLANDEDLLLVPPSEANPAESASMAFAPCKPTETGVYVAGEGIYLLTIAPAFGSVGRAPVSGLGNTEAGCNRKYILEGAQFRLVQLEFVRDLNLSNDDLKSPDRLRNVVAYKCFGVEDQAVQSFTSNPFAPQVETYGILDGLRPNRLTDCDVPLALVYWTAKDGIVFIDRWAVRRRLMQPASDRGWPFLTSDRRLAEAEARLLQFHEQIQDLVAEIAAKPGLASNGLEEFFKYLPPAGCIPVIGGGSAKGVSLAAFFGSRVVGAPTPISDSDVLGLMRRSIEHAPANVQSVDLVQLYWNQTNLDRLATGGAEQRYVVFTLRDVQGFLDNDKVVQTLRETWTSYTDLLAKGVLMPATLTDRSQPVWLTVQALHQNIMHYAMTRESAAGAGQLNRAGVQRSFQDLYDLQKQLATASQVTFEGDTTLDRRQNLAFRLTQFLDDPLPTTVPGLKPALAAGNLPVILFAQQAINRLIGVFSGEIAVGVLQLQNTGSPRGTKLVPGDPQPFPFLMTVTNRTDKRVTIAFAASVVESQSGTWGNAIQLSALSALLNSNQATVVEVRVAAPSDADPDHPVKIRFTASLPPPNDAPWPFDLNLTTASSSGPEVVWSLNPTVAIKPSATILGNAPPNSPLVFFFDTEYVAPRPPTTTDCTFVASFSFTNSQRSDWTLHIQNATGFTEPQVGELHCTFPLPGTGPLGKQRTRVTVTPLSGGPAPAKQCTLTIKVMSQVIDPATGQTVNLETTLGETFTITVQTS